MKYEQPYGVSDTNASYINGNPSTGTMGSIPPAASIENPQREIVNFITSSGLSPTDADLFQLAKAVQNGAVNFGVDQGTPNQLAVTLSPAVASYTMGMRVFVKVAYANTTQTVININAIGSVPVVHTDLSQLVGAELKQGQMVELIYDGANFQMLSGASSGGGYILMTAPRAVYVNPATGSDTAYDGSQAPVSGTHGPFQTITRALTEMTKYNLGGWQFTINLADGLYGITSIIRMPLPNGSGSVYIHGNSTTPQNVHIYNTSQGSCFFFENGGNWDIDGLSFQATATMPGDGGNCIMLAAASQVEALNMAFGPCPGAHVSIGFNSYFQMMGPVTIWGAPGAAHVQAGSNAVYANWSLPFPTLNITAAITTAAFAQVGTGAQVEMVYQSITGASSVTGAKYSVNGNGVLNLNGNGVSYLPGSAAGATATGGQVV